MTDIERQEGEQIIRQYLADGYGIFLDGGRIILDEAEAIRYLHFQQDQQGLAVPVIAVTRNYRRDTVQ